MSNVKRQLEASGLLEDVTSAFILEQNNTLRGRFDPSVINKLRQDKERFAEGALHRLHEDVGPNRVDFRSFNGTFGKGSLQLVINKETGDFYADVDKHNPYQDVVSFLGHSFREVVPNWVKKLFGKGKKNER